MTHTIVIAFFCADNNTIDLIKEDGTLDLTAAAFAEGNKFEIEVTATGYKTLSFTYEKKETTYKYVYAGLTWDEYWAAEGILHKNHWLLSRSVLRSQHPELSSAPDL